MIGGTAAASSPDTPATITLLGQEFPVLSMAYEDLRAFDIGDQMTILLSYDGQVAGAVTASAASSTTVPWNRSSRLSISR